MLHEFLDVNRKELAARCRTKSTARSSVPGPTEDLEHGIPALIDQLVQMLRVEGKGREILEPAIMPSGIGVSAAKHGGDLLRHGFTVNQVVHDYGDLCQALTELAHEKHEPISVGEFHTFNRCLDSAIADAVGEFGRLRDRANSDDTAQTLNDRLGLFAYELRALLNAATLAYDAIKAGHVSAAGATGSVVERSLDASRALLDHMLAEARLSTGLQPRLEQTLVAMVLQQVAVAAQLEARDRKITFTVASEPAMSVIADPQMLSAALANLLSNAFKFTRHGGHITVRAHDEAGHALIEVADECGGLPLGSADKLFMAREHEADLRSGLSISRRSIEAIGGTLGVKDIPGTGCVFTIDLPKKN